MNPAPALRFEPMQGPGLDLTVITGHPEHELLFVATQVLNQAGLKDGKRQIQRYKEAEGMYQIRDIIAEVSTLDGKDITTIEHGHPVAPFVSACKALIGPAGKMAGSAPSRSCTGLCSVATRRCLSRSANG